MSLWHWFYVSNTANIYKDFFHFNLVINQLIAQNLVL